MIRLLYRTGRQRAVIRMKTQFSEVQAYTMKVTGMGVAACLHGKCSQCSLTGWKSLLFMGAKLFLSFEKERGRENEISVAEEFKGPVWKI